MTCGAITGGLRGSISGSIRGGITGVISAATLVLALLPRPVWSEPMILAAASTNRALEAALEASGQEAVASYGASGMLARQVEQGAPADLFVSANPKWMGYLVEAGLVETDSVKVLMSNSLVLIAPEDAPGWDDLALADRLAGDSFVVANPETAPVGAYGKAALESLGFWDTVAPAMVPMRNTLATVAAVAQGEAALGLVYASDAAGQPVQVLWNIPTDSHPDIRYLVAPVGQGDDPEGARKVLDFLLSDAGAAILEAHGFLATGGL
ncbi:MAG: molybdate ABC transporter substrate-binding protein [Rhodobacteraceae bacterium]|nr:molybdate ABC transporter substrate-binding protein [Paracoccaceae bacterium]